MNASSDQDPPPAAARPAAQAAGAGQPSGQPYIPPPAGAYRFPAAPAAPAAQAAPGYSPYASPSAQEASPAPSPYGAPGALPYGAPAAAPTPSTYLAQPAPAATPAWPAAGGGAGNPRAAAASRAAPAPAANPATQNPAGAYPAPYPAPYPVAQAQPYVPAPVQAAPPLPYAAQPWNAAPAAERPQTALDELTAIQQERSPTFTVGGTVRSRQGEDGLGKLTDLEAPVEYKFPAGDGKVALRATPVSLDSGTPGSAYDANSRFGGGPAAAMQQAGGGRSAGSQDASGIGLGLGYESDRLQADLGTTPLGFRYTDFNGGIKIKGSATPQLSYAVEASRRPVTESLLSFAGARDARTGQTWGGVSNSGVRVDVGWDDGQYGIYGYGSFGYLDGNNVASNTRVEGGGGLYWRMLKSADSELITGVNLTGIAYDKNLRYFTYGQGGYFSPQQFFAVSIPVSWSQRADRLSYQVKGSIGVQHFREDSSPYFPTNSGLQAAAAQSASDALALGLSTNTNGAYYPGQTKTGIGYNLAASAEYQIAPQLTVGGLLAMDNARDYRQLLGGVYLRYALQPYTGLAAFPIAPYRSTYPTN